MYELDTELLIDRNQRLTRMLDATVTPQAFLLDSIGQVAYSGKIDDKYFALGQHKFKTQNFFLRDATEAYLAGTKIAVPKTDPVGCFIQRK